EDGEVLDQMLSGRDPSGLSRSGGLAPPDEPPGDESVRHGRKPSARVRIMYSMPVRRTAKHPPASRLAAMTRRLLDQSTLCAIATVSPGARAHVNTAYFAWGPAFEIVWLSAPEAQHSRNIRANPSAAVSVYRSTQTWGGSDHGIQLFATA